MKIDTITSSRRFHQRPHGLSSRISLSSSESSSSAINVRLQGDLETELLLTAADPPRFKVNEAGLMQAALTSALMALLLADVRREEEDEKSAGDREPGACRWTWVKRWGCKDNNCGWALGCCCWCPVEAVDKTWTELAVLAVQVVVKGEAFTETLVLLQTPLLGESWMDSMAVWPRPPQSRIFKSFNRCTRVNTQVCIWEKTLLVWKLI